jgi:hypothetical protein
VVNVRNRARLPRTIATALLSLLTLAACALPSDQSGSVRFTTPLPLQAGHRHIYWADPTADWTPGDPIAGTGTIGGANLDATGITEAAVTGLESPCGVAVNGTHLFWANRRQDGIGRANLDGSGLDNLFVRTPSGSYPCGVAVDGSFVYWANHGYGTRGTTIGRAKLDGSSVEGGFVGGALNPCGVAVDGEYIYWANEEASPASGGTIGRARLDGSDADADFIQTDAVLPCGVAVDGSYVYWANTAGGSIGRASLDGTAVENRFIDGARWPCGVTVDGDYVYWGNAGEYLDPSGQTAAVGRARLDGTGVDQDWVTGMLGICGVVVDPD